MNETLTTPALAELLPLVREQTEALRQICVALCRISAVLYYFDDCAATPGGLSHDTHLVAESIKKEAAK